MRYLPVTALTIVLTVSASGAAARPGSKAADPASPSAPVPALKYESAFSDYRPFGDDQMIPWKSANDEVGRIGGWQVYAREARQPAAVQAPPEIKTPTSTPTPSAPATKPTPDAAPKPTPGGHAGHQNR